MAVWMPSQGDTLLVPSGPGGERHLFVVLLGPVVLPGYGANQQIAMVSLTSIRAGVPYDPSVVWNVGDHQFVQHPSYLSYRHMRLDQLSHAQQMVLSGVWTPNQPCSSQHLQQAIAGVCHSKLTPRVYKGIFGCP